MNEQDIFKFNIFKKTKESTLLLTKLNENLIRFVLDKINLIFDDGIVECDILLDVLCPCNARKDGPFCFSLVKLHMIRSHNKKLRLYYVCK